MFKYSRFVGHEVVDARTGVPLPRGPARDSAAQFYARMIVGDYVCVGAQAAMANGNVRIAFVDQQLGTHEAATQALDVITLFLEDLPSLKPPYRPLVMAYKGPKNLEPGEGHELSWSTLNAMTVIDRATYPLAAGVSEDPASPHFAFSWRGQQWFVNCGWDAHPRLARDFCTPLWVINPQSNFEMLREIGQFEALKAVNARRDLAYQGTPNDLLADRGKGLQWPQVTSAEGQPSPTCPFHHKHEP